MKRNLLISLAGMCLIVLGPLLLALVQMRRLVIAQPPPSLHLTQISSREFVDLSKISFVRLPVYLPPVPGCPDCQLRYGADFVVDGVDEPYSEDAEATFRRLLAEQK